MTESREGMVVRLSPSSTRRCVGVHVHAASSASSSHLSVLCSISAAVRPPLPSLPHPFIFFHPLLSFSFFLQAKTTKKIVLRMECTVQDCKRKKHKALKRCKHFELGGDKKRKVGSHTTITSMQLWEFQ